MRPVAPVILLVHPERDDRDTYADFLSYFGLTPLCAQEGPEALRLAPGADVIVTELLLTGPVDGFGLIEALKRDALTRHVPVVVLTVCDWIEEETRARTAGCDVFLSKPCCPATLLCHVRRILARRGGSHGSEYRLGHRHQEKSLIGE